MADPALRKAVLNKDFVLAPGVFELISALIADRMDFKALYVTGYGTVASYLGLPDAGLAFDDLTQEADSATPSELAKR
jgi:2-methylisocitrate lyase-like PEP mutase family enzyme